MDIEIKDKVIITPPQIATEIYMIISNLILFESVTVRVLFFKFEDKCRFQIDEQTVIMAGEDYLRWGTDDNYLENYVFEKLQIDKK